MEIWNCIGMFSSGFILGFIMCTLLHIAKDKL